MTIFSQGLFMVCLLLVFCKLNDHLVVFYIAKSKRRQLPPLACYWLRPWSLGSIVPHFYRKNPFFGVRSAICFNIGRDRKHPLMFKIDIGKLHSEQEMCVWEHQKLDHILPRSHWSRGTAWHSAKITKKTWPKCSKLPLIIIVAPYKGCIVIDKLG